MKPRFMLHTSPPPRVRVTVLDINRSNTMHTFPDLFIQWSAVFFQTYTCMYICIRVSQEERSVFWKVIVSVIVNKKVYMYMCLIPNRFQVKLFHSTVPKLCKERDITYCF
jgi:hypothetical protein